MQEARLENAQYAGLASRIRDLIWGAPPELVAHHRQEWPALWATLDDLVAHVDERFPPYGPPPQPPPPVA